MPPALSPPDLLISFLLLQDLGMESTSLDDVLYRYASFRNLVDPITHDLVISLARYIHCPKPVGGQGPRGVWSEHFPGGPSRMGSLCLPLTS